MSLRRVSRVPLESPRMRHLPFCSLVTQIRNTDSNDVPRAANVHENGHCGTKPTAGRPHGVIFMEEWCPGAEAENYNEHGM